MKILRVGGEGRTGRHPVRDRRPQNLVRGGPRVVGERLREVTAAADQYRRVVTRGGEREIVGPGRRDRNDRARGRGVDGGRGRRLPRRRGRGRREIGGQVGLARPRGGGRRRRRNLERRRRGRGESGRGAAGGPGTGSERARRAAGADRRASR